MRLLIPVQDQRQVCGRGGAEGDHDGCASGTVR
jgi:hypothetical protein